MDTKRVFVCFVCLLVLFSMAACSASSAPSTQQTMETIGTEGAQSPTSSAENHDPPYTVSIETVDDLRAFFADESWTENAGPTENQQSIYQFEAQNIADRYTNAAVSMCYFIPDTSEDQIYLNGKYYPSNQSLDFIYYSDGIQYCFIYFFDRDSDWYYGEKPAFSDVQVGPYIIDFYRLEKPYQAGKYYLLGHVAGNGIDLLVRITGDNQNDFNFEMFDYISLTSNDGDVVA